MARATLPRTGRCLSSITHLLALCAMATLFAACSKDAPASRELQPGSYRATVELPGGKVVPFGLDVAQEERGMVLYLVNGPERVRIDEVHTKPGSLEARVPGYETVIRAQVAGAELTGKVSLMHPGGKLLELPFQAHLGEAWRFFPEALQDNADFAGRWSITFTDAQGRRITGVATFEQSYAQVTGTVQLPADDQRWLAGEAHDEELRLSRFDGGAIVLYEAKLNEHGELVGETWSDRGGARKFVATRNPDASIDPSALATHLRDPEAPFAFSFRNLDGQTVASTAPQFKDKVLLVTLAGSWCPNSHDQAQQLAGFDRRYRARGLEIVSLMFEQHADFGQAVAAVERFRQAYGVGYLTLIAGESSHAQASSALPQLDAVLAYPTTLFVDRTGKVRKIRTGYAGPSTGVLHELLAHEDEQTIEELLAEVSPGSS